MTRPLIRYNIVQLEELYASSGKDPSALKQLWYELQFRQVPRAVALVEKLRGILHTGNESAGITIVAATAVPPGQPPIHPDLSAGPHSPSSRTTPQAARKAPGAIAAGDVPQGTLALTLPHSESPLIAITPDAMSVGDAYKALRVTPGSTWEAIEQARRRIVQQAHPDCIRTLDLTRRVQAQVTAKRANAAYALLRTTTNVS